MSVAAWIPDANALSDWGRKPVVLTGGGVAPTSLLSFDDVDELLTCRILRYPDFRVVEGTEPLDPRAYTRKENDGVGSSALVLDLDALYDHFDRGASLVLQDLQRYWQPVQVMSREIEAMLGLPAPCYAFITPTGVQGLALHTDHVDSLILQTVGSKQWTVFPATPVNDTRATPVPVDDPVIEVELRAGDVLHVPRHFPHMASTTRQPSIHLNFTVFGRTWGALFAKMLEQAGASEAGLREIVPVDPLELRAELPGRLAALEGWIAKVGADSVAEWIDRTFPVTASASPHGRVSGLAALQSLDDDTMVAWRGDRVRSMEVDDEAVTVHLDDRVVRVPAWVGPALAQLRAEPVMRAGDLDAVLDTASRNVLIRRLAREGLLRIGAGRDGV
jgi:hypothetical protein